jgi:MraZ protein
MSGFYGEYNVSMDAKGRLMLPADFRKKLQESDLSTFTVKRGSDKCLTLYTQSEWKRLGDELEQMSAFNPSVNKFKRLFLDGIAQIDMDSAGRLLIPKALQEYAGLSKEVVFWLQGNKVEIWDKTRKEQYLELVRDQEESLANELFKGI